MTKTDAARRMRIIDRHLIEIDLDAEASGTRPFDYPEYGSLLADWLDASWWFYVGADQESNTRSPESCSTSKRDQASSPIRRSRPGFLS
mgnify:CR=1 FL=1